MPSLYGGVFTVVADMTKVAGICLQAGETSERPFWNIVEAAYTARARFFWLPVLLNPTRQLGRPEYEDVRRMIRSPRQASPVCRSMHAPGAPRRRGRTPGGRVLFPASGGRGTPQGASHNPFVATSTGSPGLDQAGTER